MTVYAKVIVDVAAGGVDRPFDYRLKDAHLGVAAPGMRVLVPFGKRKLTGIIVELSDTASVKNVKSISELLDVTPVLSPELLDLGSWLAKETTCFQITALFAMIPAAMRAKAQKFLVLNEKANHVDVSVQALFGQRIKIPFKEIPEDKTILKAVSRGIQENVLSVYYELKDGAKHKEQKAVTTLQSAQQPKTTKQQETLATIERVADSGAVPVATLINDHGLSRSTIQTLIKNEFLEEHQIVIERNPYERQAGDGREAKRTLTHDQHVAYESIRDAVEERSSKPMLLHGITGSGKTEVYLQAIEQVLKEGREAIVLVPEISLTPQMVERFKRRFGDHVAVMHSALSSGERYDEWMKIHRNEVQVVVGARSAVFAPFNNIGLIIIDEEHESSYKQEDYPRYHAREVAIYRSQTHECPVVLGSATPSMESFARAKKDVYTLLSLPERVNKKPLPAIELIDMRDELRGGNRSVFSSQLLDKVKDRLAKEEQIVLFLNRRGFSTFVMCRSCGYVGDCPHCEISLTYHQRGNQLKCHYCGHEETMYEECPACESEHIRFFGTGTQKVEEELQKLLPEARIIRMDNDTTRKKGSHEALLKRFGNHEADILLGTQMIAKGLDFPKITLAGVLTADTLLNLPDFRAPERTFQLLTQLGGRAGRDKREGEVVIQTYTPEHYAIQHAKSHDFEGFFAYEMQQRRQAGYPPYYFICLITFSHEELLTAMKAAERATRFLKERLSDQSVILGPTPSPISRINDRYRTQCMIKYKREPNFSEILSELFTHYQQEVHKDSRFMAIDRHPNIFM
nr:primosomal protein N' [Geomicrobium sp. JCM 19038]